MGPEIGSGYDPKNHEIIVDSDGALNFLLASAYWLILSEAAITQQSICPLLEDVGRIFVATTSSKKLEAVEDFFTNFSIIRGGEFVETNPIPTPGSEPPDEEAILVASDKVVRAIAHLTSRECDQRPGPRAAVIGLDTVVRARNIMSPKFTHLFNLSRIKDKEGNLRKCHLDERAAELREIYCNGPSIVEYDIAAVVSVKVNGNGRNKNRQVAMTGIRITIHLDQIDEETLNQIYSDPDQISKIIGINAGLPVADEGSPILKRITKVEVRPLAKFAVRRPNKGKGYQIGQIDPTINTESIKNAVVIDVIQLSQKQRDELFAIMRTWIIGNVPPNFGALFTVDPEINGELKVV